jgi:hypothetical protein
MMLLLVVPPAAGGGAHAAAVQGDVEKAARELAAISKDSVYDARQRLVRGVPFVLETSEARDIGVESYVISEPELEALPSVLPAKLVTYDDNALILDLTPMPWREIDCVVRVRLDKDISTETERADLKIRPSVMGVKVTQKTSRDVTKDREIMFGVIIGCRDPLSTRVLLQKDIDYTKLALPLQPTSLANYQAFVALIEKRTPHALHDRGLEQVGRNFSTTVKERGYRGQSAALATMRSHTTTSDNWDAVMHAARMVIFAQRMRTKSAAP